MTYEQYDRIDAWLEEDPIKMVTITLNKELGFCEIRIITPKVMKNGTLETQIIKVPITKE